jgi:glycosyltransferase involved in cell wall biosynthesis
MQSVPAASIIISAYNRPAVLKFAILSVLNSDTADWELIIVGDGCNAATEAVAKSFRDPRISFFNLPKNTGSQSAPHNFGVERARGEFVLFLNQDDMYFPDHVSASIAFMRETGAEIAWSPVFLLEETHSSAGPIDATLDQVTLDGAVGNSRFDPLSFMISSSWIVRRDICAAVGPWLDIEATRLSPSQEWLYRASRQGRRMVFHRHVSVLCIHSGGRRYSFVIPDSPEHERAWEWINAGPSERARLLDAVAVQQASELTRLRAFRERRRHPFRTLVERASKRLGIHPHSAGRFLRRVGKGSWVKQHRRFTSEPPRIVDGGALELGGEGLDLHLGKGWRAAGKGGRWTTGATAEIFFSVAPNGGDRFAELSARLSQPGKIAVKVNDLEAVEHVLGGEEATIRLALPEAGPYRLALSTEQATGLFVTRLRVAGSERVPE